MILQSAYLLHSPPWESPSFYIVIQNLPMKLLAMFVGPTMSNPGQTVSLKK